MHSSRREASHAQQQEGSIPCPAAGGKHPMPSSRREASHAQQKEGSIPCPAEGGKHPMPSSKSRCGAVPLGGTVVS